MCVQWIRSAHGFSLCLGGLSPDKTLHQSVVDTDKVLTALPPQAFVDEARDELIKMQVLQGSDEAEPLQPDLPGFKVRGQGVAEGG